MWQTGFVKLGGGGLRVAHISAPVPFEALLQMEIDGVQAGHSVLSVAGLG